MKITPYDNGVRVTATLHRGGEYDQDSIYRGGEAVTKSGRIVIRRETYGRPDWTAPCDKYRTIFGASIELDDGDSQSVALYQDAPDWPLLSVERA